MDAVVVLQEVTLVQQAVLAAVKHDIQICKDWIAKIGFEVPGAARLQPGGPLQRLRQRLIWYLRNF